MTRFMRLRTATGLAIAKVLVSLNSPTLSRVEVSGMMQSQELYSDSPGLVANRS